MRNDRGFGRRLIEIRRALRLSQQELASKAGCHQTTVSRLERGDHAPTLALLMRLARGLGIEAAALLPKK